ncbi:endonuclease [Tamlana sp. 62-3]|uniref:Endonuclease n=1 Tax=Neotamlana sargassicola TaxID=2883125 RepID=A0A9X1L5V5_9FLAO|nr:endonuclease [Tamlana sargassicola]MCB4806959.1 endonuclease [Tamlana sargassicola]
MSDIFDDIPVRNDLQTIAFYNLENLFDIHKDRNTHDSDFLPTSVKRWTPKRYDNKLRKLSYAISNIGKRETGKNPAIVGLAEVENATVIQDLLNYKHLKDYNYGFVHYDSPDERGIDVALIYDKASFEVLHSETYSVLLRDEDGSPDYTRDILLVSGRLDEEKVHVIVTHWSSRREGQKETEYKRMASSNKVAEIITKLKQENEDARIIVMGDFNDEPDNKSIKNLVDNFGLYNPMETLRSFSRGTTYHHRKWNLFDQIMFTTNYFKNSNNEFEFFKANIFDEDFLKTFSGRYKGSPFRTYVGKKYNGGYSDHFPVYTVFKK